MHCTITFLLSVINCLKVCSFFYCWYEKCLKLQIDNGMNEYILNVNMVICQIEKGKIFYPAPTVQSKKLGKYCFEIREAVGSGAGGDAGKELLAITSGHNSLIENSEDTTIFAISYQASQPLLECNNG